MAPRGGRAEGLRDRDEGRPLPVGGQEPNQPRGGPVAPGEPPLAPRHREGHPQGGQGLVPGQPPRHQRRRPGEGAPEAPHVSRPVGDLSLDPVGPSRSEGVPARRAASPLAAVAEPRPQGPVDHAGRVGRVGPVIDPEQPGAANHHPQPGWLAIDRHPKGPPRSVRRGTAAGECGKGDDVAPGPAHRHAQEGAGPDIRHAGAVQPHAQRRVAALHREGEGGPVGHGGRHRDQREPRARRPWPEHGRDGGAGVQGARAAAPVGAGACDVACALAQDRLDVVRSEGPVGLAQERDRSGDVGRRHRGAAHARPRSTGGARDDPVPGGGQVGLERRRVLAGARRAGRLGASGSPAREGGHAPAGAQGPHRQALAVGGRGGHAAAGPAVARREDRHDPQVAPAPDEPPQRLAAGARRLPPGGVDDARGVVREGVAVGIGDPLAGGQERAEGGGAVAVERLGHHHPRPGGHPDGRAAGGAADHGADGVGAVAVVVVGRWPAVDEVAPGGDFPRQVGMLGVDAGVDRADPDPAPVQPIVAPHRRRPRGRQAPAAPANEPHRGVAVGLCRRREEPHAPVGLDPSNGRIVGESPDLGRPGPQGDRVHEPQPARRARKARQEGRLAARSRAPQRADQVAGPACVAPGVHLVAKGDQHGQRPVRARKAGAQRGGERRRRIAGGNRWGRRGVRGRADTGGRGDGGHGDEGDESTRR